MAVESPRIDPRVALTLVRVVLDIVRKNRALAFPFFQEYVDPNKKRRYRELEAEPYDVRFPDRDRAPKAFALDRPDHIRKAGRLLGFIQENPRAGQLTAVQKVVARVPGADRHRAEAFLRTLVPLLKKLEILVAVPEFPIPKKERVAKLEPLQVDPRVIRLRHPEVGFRCNACQTWRPYAFPTCPNPRCSVGELQPRARDSDNYYIRLYLDREPLRLLVSEHSALIDGEERARRETAFKEGKLDVLVCSPTLELGVDIGPLLTVVLRNAPPAPANYAQRVGRAGRRLRIGFVSTFCAGGAHDRHAFEHPEWLVAGRFEPPRIRLDNPKVVKRHLRSYILELIGEQLPSRMGDLLDDLRSPTAWQAEKLAPLFAEVTAKREGLIERLAALLEPDRVAGRTERWGAEEVANVVDHFEPAVTEVFDAWWQRVAQLDREFREFSTVGSPRQDNKKAAARQRAYWEITQDPTRAYVLNYLSTRGLLPAYQFPVDTFSLDPGVEDTQTLYRAAAIAIEEFAPGNYVYANGHKLRSIRVLFPGGPGAAGAGRGRSDAEASGRLQSFHFCPSCEEAVEAPRNVCPRCGGPLPERVDAVFVDAFEAEENLRIGSEEESRERQYQLRRENLLVREANRAWLYPYPLAPIEYVRLAEILVTNWGRSDSKTGEGARFWLCPDCGRHMPHDLGSHERQEEEKVNKWQEHHGTYCAGSVSQLILAYRFETDCLVLTVPQRGDQTRIGRSSYSPALVTLAEGLVAGAGSLLELEPGELTAFVRGAPPEKQGDQIVFYETAPGGAGYVEELARRLPEVAQKARERLYGHDCSKGCYLCLKNYGNQRWHPFFDKECIRDVLLTLENQEPVEPIEGQPGAGVEMLTIMLDERKAEAEHDGERDPGTGTYRKGYIEEPLREALARIAGMPQGRRDYEFKEEGRVITVPDFTWEDAKLAVYCDGFAHHGDANTLALDAKKRNLLQARGWVVLTYWGRTILRNSDACAREIAGVYRGTVGSSRAHESSSG